MSNNPDSNFTGIVSCFGNFNDDLCLTKTIEFSLSFILFITAIVLFYHYLRFFGFKDKIYINIAILCMIGYLIMNIFFCFWNTQYEFYSLQTYFHNLYFLVIVIFTTKSYLIKKSPKKQLQTSRVSNVSNISSESDEGFLANIKNKIVNNRSCNILIYKVMGIIFLILFTMIFISSLIGDIKSKQAGQNISEDQGSEQDQSLFAFLKNSCQQLWYLCVNVICAILGIIVLIVLIKNYRFQKQKIKQLTLSSTFYNKQSPFSKRNSSSSSYKIKQYKQSKKLNNPLAKLSLWMGANIFGEIVNLVESGLLLQADSTNQCLIITNSQLNNSILMLLFVVLSIYVQFSFSLWFFYQVLKQKTQISSKTQKLLQPHEFSQEIRVGQIQMNPSLSKASHSVSD